MRHSPKNALVLMGLLLAAACGDMYGGAWGTEHSEISWATDLTADPATRISGLAEGAISNVTLMRGGQGSVHIALWSNGTGITSSSGGGPATGSFLHGQVSSPSFQPVSFSFSSGDDPRVQGTIGDQAYTLEAGGLFLIHADGEEVRVEQVAVPAEALEAFDVSEQSEREAFAAQWGVETFFRAATGR